MINKMLFILLQTMDTASQDDYFLSYEEVEVHKLMLKDQSRTKAYQKFIESNKALFEDKVVVDVGAGIGILSLFAAKAGAKQVNHEFEKT